MSVKIQKKRAMLDCENCKLMYIITPTYDGEKCNMLYQGKIWGEYGIQSGVHQGCIPSPVLFFLLSFTFFMLSCPKNTEDYYGGHSYADDIWLFSQRVMDLGQTRTKDEHKQN